MSRVAVLKGGRSLERQVSLRSGARVEDALERLGHEASASTSATTSSRGCASWRPTSLRRAARPRRRGRHRPGAARGPRHPVHRLGRQRLHPLRRQGPGQAPHASTPGLPTPDFFAFTETAFKELGAAEALRRDRGAARLPDRRQARRPGQRAGHPVRRARRRTCRARWWPRSPTRARCCSSATSPAATSRSRSSTARRCRSSRRSPRTGFYDFEARYEIGRTDVRLPGRPAGDDVTARAQELALDGPRAARLPRLLARRPDARRATATCTCSRPTSSRA